jgi:membrane dipeptidase
MEGKAGMILVDAHQDLAWNMLTFDRDYTLSAAEIRRREQGSGIWALNGDTLLGWPEYQSGKVAMVFATLFAAPERRQLGPWDRLCYSTADEARKLYLEQLDVYHRLCDDHPDKFNLVLTRGDLDDLLSHWERPDKEEHPVGLVILMEGAEGVREPGELEDWWNRGVRALGPAWAGNRFSGGTREPGPLTPEGYALLDAMATWGFILDISHMDEKATLQALDVYPQAVVATHANAARLLRGVESNRFLSDRVIYGLRERDGIIGVVPFNRFLKVGWEPQDGRQAVTLPDLVAHIDAICQMAGDANHAGIGSDFDGGFGLQSTPAELDTIADLHKVVPILAEKGYTDEDIAAILGQNWVSLLRRTLPETA